MVGPLRLIQFRVVSGRVLLTSQQIGRTISTTAKANGREESLSINLADGTPLLRYELGTNEERVVVSAAHGNELTVRREPRGDSLEPFLELTQPAHGPLSLTIRGKEATEPRVVQGGTLWHLALAEPTAVQQQLLPILEILQPDWKLATVAVKLEESLLRLAPRHRAANRAAWSALVTELGSDRYATRAAADRKLRSVGAAVVPYLNGLDRSRLSAEQQLRVRRIVAALAGNNADDSSERVADWLAWDPQAWLELLSREDEAVRRTAAGQMSLLLDAPIDFDPAAEPAVRAEQIQRLRPRAAPR